MERKSPGKTRWRLLALLPLTLLTTTASPRGKRAQQHCWPRESSLIPRFFLIFPRCCRSPTPWPKMLLTKNWPLVFHLRILRQLALCPPCPSRFNGFLILSKRRKASKWKVAQFGLNELGLVFEPMRLAARFRGKCTDGCAAQSAQRVVATIRSTLATGALCRSRGFLIAAPVPERVSIPLLDSPLFPPRPQRVSIGGALLALSIWGRDFFTSLIKGAGAGGRSMRFFLRRHAFFPRACKSIVSMRN